jgi:RNA polymerase sigma factor for flagellar operon FliA
VGEAQSTGARLPLPEAAAGTPEMEQRLLAHLPEIDRIVAFVCRRNGLEKAEADDFRSLVHLKLIENDYEVLRRFRGQSTLRTYLTVVVQRRFLDHRISEWGKWRPSAEARRLGPVAVELERLTGRDGLTLGEAIETMRTRAGEPPSRETLLDLAAKLPARAPRRFVGEDHAEALPARENVERDAIARQAAQTGDRAAAALKEAISSLPAQDRLILRMRFGDGFTVARIASILQLDQKALYRRIAGILAGLKDGLESAGLSRPEISALLDGGGEFFDGSTRMFETCPSIETGSGG